MEEKASLWIINWHLLAIYFLGGIWIFPLANSHKKRILDTKSWVVMQCLPLGWPDLSGFSVMLWLHYIPCRRNQQYESANRPARKGKKSASTNWWAPWLAILLKEQSKVVCRWDIFKAGELNKYYVSVRFVVIVIRIFTIQPKLLYELLAAKCWICVTICGFQKMVK